MKRTFIIIALAGWLIFPAFGQHPPHDKNWQVVSQDNFNGPQLSSLWYRSEGTKNAGKDNEAPYFMIKNNVYIEDNTLVLRMKKEPSPIVCIPKNGNPCKYPGGIHPYTSGSITSNNKYKYGYYEMYAKWDAGMGLFPAFWFWGCVDSLNLYNEIDIMESTGCEPNIITTNDWIRPCDTVIDNTTGTFHHYCNHANTFHWFGVEWDKDKITWYIDRKAVAQARNNLLGIGIHNPMNLTINFQLIHWVWGGCALDPTIDSAFYYIDQVNAYQLIYDCNNKNISISDSTALANHDNKVKTSITLSGANTITPGKNVSLRASNYIELKNDFYVPPDAELYLDINPCENSVRVRRE